jgi:hypothetical protein
MAEPDGLYEGTDLGMDEMSIPTDTSFGDKDGETRGGNRPVDRLVTLQLSLGPKS